MDSPPLDPDATLAPGAPRPQSSPGRELPEQLGKFCPVALLGQGGMGEVFEAKDPELQRNVAVKTLRPELAGNRATEQRFLREACSVGRLEHPNIPTVHEVGRGADGHPYFTMRLIRGKDLGSVIERLQDGDAALHTELTFRRRAQIILDVCDALHYAHGNGVLHRDLKPQNVMLGDSGEVLLIDWGISKDQTLEGPAAPSDAGFTGTLRYSPPERLRPSEDSNDDDPRSDIYSLGAVMYELFSLQAAFPQSSSARRLYEAVLRDNPARAERIAHPAQGYVPKEFADIIHKAMAKQPSERYSDAQDFGQAIRSAIDGHCPVVCVCTGLKRGLFWADYLVNNRPVLLVLALLLWILGPFCLLAYHLAVSG